MKTKFITIKADNEGDIALNVKEIRTIKLGMKLTFEIEGEHLAGYVFPTSEEGKAIFKPPEKIPENIPLVSEEKVFLFTLADGTEYMALEIDGEPFSSEANLAKYLNNL